MRKLAMIACCLLVCLTATQAMAVNSVVVESKSAAAGATNVQVGVFITNDQPIVGFVLPLEIRTHSGSAFYFGNVLNTVFNYNATGRLKNSPLGDVAGATWPAGNVTRRQYADPTTNSCSGPTSSTFAAAAARGDTASPDGFLLATVSTGDPNIGDDITLVPGSDGATPSLLFVLNLLPQDGCMVIDTACVTPANHLVGVDESTAEVFFSFTPGFLTVGSGSCVAQPNVAPTAVCQNVTVAAGPTCQAAVTAAQVNNGSSDPEDGTNVTLALVPAGPYNLGVNNVQLIVTDTEGAADTCAATITVVDETDPVVTCRPDTTLSVPNGTPGIVVNFTAGTATDNCDGSVTIVATPASGSSFPVGSTPVVVIATDDAGNADTCTFNVIVNELPPVNQPPTAICQNVTVPAGDSCLGVTTAAAVNNGSSDPEDGTALTLALVPPGPFPKGTTNVKLIVTDTQGASDTCDATVTVVDETDPSITCPPGIFVQCASAVPAPYADAAAFATAGGSYRDNCPGTVWSYDGQVSDGQSCPEVITRTYRVTDAAGNFATCQQLITIRDTIAPEVQCPNDTLIIVPFGTTSAVVNFTINATDNCDPSLTIIATPASGSTFNEGATQVTATITDDCGNEIMCGFVVTVQQAAQDEPPTAICKNITLSADANCQASGSINNGSFDPDGGSVTTVQTPAGPYGLGTTNVTLLVTDDEGDTASCSATVTVNDVTAPTVTCPANITVDNTPGQCGATVNYLVSADDNCDASPTVTATPPGTFFPIGTTTVNVSAMDDAGNASSCSFTVTVNDTQAPLATCPPSIVDTAAPGENCLVVTFSIGASDNCPGVSVSSNPVSGFCFPVGVTTVVVTATDLAGNTDTCNFTVTIEGTVVTVPPVANCVQNLELAAGPTCTANGSVDDGSYDPDGGAVTLAQYPAGPYPIGQTNVTLVVHDDEGDSAVCLSTVTVRDLTPPTVTCPGDTTITIQEGETCVAVNHVASAFDFCGLQSLTAAPPSGFCFPVGATLVTVIGTDLAGNADTCTFTVTVETEGGQLEAVLDIKPGSCPNPVNVERNWNKSKAVLPVAILGTMDFDVHEIDPMTVRLEGVAPLRWSFENVSRPVMDPEECECTSAGPDRIMDMTLKFQLSEILAAIAPLSHGTEVLLTLTGLTEDGDEFVASDCIRVIGDLTSLPKVAMVPGDFGLTNSPNPFNAGTVIQYALPEDGSVRLEIFNILGQSMGVLVNEFQAAGPHSVSWDGRDVSGAQVPSGIYLYRLQAGAEMTTRKMVLMK